MSIPAASARRVRPRFRAKVAGSSGADRDITHPWLATGRRRPVPAAPSPPRHPVPPVVAGAHGAGHDPVGFGHGGAVHAPPVPGVDPRDVVAVCVSHFHNDRSGGLRHFARRVPARAARRVRRGHGRPGPGRARGGHVPRGLGRPGDGLALLDGDAEIAPGLHALLTAGHTRATPASWWSSTRRPTGPTACPATCSPATPPTCRRTWTTRSRPRWPSAAPGFSSARGNLRAARVRRTSFESRAHFHRLSSSCRPGKGSAQTVAAARTAGRAVGSASRPRRPRSATRAATVSTS